MTTTTFDIAKLTEIVTDMVNAVRANGVSKYYSIPVGEDEDSITIRVADHMANPARVSGRTIFFIVESECDKSMVNKKSFAPLTGRIYLENDNCDENGYDIEYLLDYELN